jgi:cytochrome c556
MYLKTVCIILLMVLTVSSVSGANASADVAKQRAQLMKSMDSTLKNIMDSTYGLYPYTSEH